MTNCNHYRQLGVNNTPLPCATPKCLNGINGPTWCEAVIEPIDFAILTAREYCSIAAKRVYWERVIFYLAGYTTRYAWEKTQSN